MLIGPMGDGSVLWLDSCSLHQTKAKHKVSVFLSSLMIKLNFIIVPIMSHSVHYVCIFSTLHFYYNVRHVKK